MVGLPRALNGLGYGYFYGEVLEKNLTRAFEYFLRAANMQQDGDSYFNAAYCLEHGLGTDRNLTWAAELYTAAAEKFGHFDSVNSIGKQG